MALVCEDWRDAPSVRIAALYAAEVGRWGAELQWDTTLSWVEVERGRDAGHVPGFIVRDADGDVLGWSFYLVHNRVLQVGGFVATSEAASETMLDAILEAADPDEVDSISFFAFAEATYLGPLLRRKGLSVDRYFYMTRKLDPSAAPPLHEGRRWRADDIPATAELLKRAYATPDEARPFAPHATSADWLDYVTQLTAGPGCGTLLPEACIALPGGPGRLSAVALVTRISPGTAHIAQIAVDPGMQKRGFGGTLLGAAGAAAARLGCVRVTLLVGGRNRAARRLYESARLDYGPSFLAGGTFQPRRSTRVAPGARATAFR